MEWNIKERKENWLSPREDFVWTKPKFGLYDAVITTGYISGDNTFPQQKWQNECKSFDSPEIDVTQHVLKSTLWIEIMFIISLASYIKYYRSWMQMGGQFHPEALKYFLWKAKAISVWTKIVFCIFATLHTMTFLLNCKRKYLACKTACYISNLKVGAIFWMLLRSLTYMQRDKRKPLEQKQSEYVAH